MTNAIRMTAPFVTRLAPVQFECACSHISPSFAAFARHRDAERVQHAFEEPPVPACGLCAKGLERYWRLGGRWHTTKLWYHKLDSRNKIACGNQEPANEHDPVHAR